MRRLFIVITLLTVATTHAEPVYLGYRQAFGIKASNIAGYGAFYGYKPTGKLRVQTTGIFYMLDNIVYQERHRIRNYSIGLEIQKDIIQEPAHRIYLMAGGYYYHDDHETLSETRPFHAIKDSRNGGLGMGYEYFFHRVTLGLETGYKFYRDKSREKEGKGNWVPVLEKVTKLGAGLNLGFVF